ncbi:MAG: Rne/Rng family ribonuclease [Candidatus Acidiferrales bacterium]
MSKEMVISANPHETRVAILEEGQLCEYYVEREKEFALVGSIYKGKVTRVLPGMQSAFVEIGLDSDAFLYVSDFLEEIEELDHVVTAVEDKTQKMEAEGGQVFPVHAGSAPIIEPVDVESSPAPGLAALPGESISGMAPGALIVSRESAGAPATDRPRFENRPPSRPGGDRGGRNSFGRRGSSGGGRGRQGGRGGRGGRGGDRRFGRELPSSKYASPRPFDGQPSEPVGPEGHISVLLPGESLAKFKERSPSDLAASAPPSFDGATASASAPPYIAHESDSHEAGASVTEPDELVAPEQSSLESAERQPTTHESSPRESFPARDNFSPRTPVYRPSSSSGLEPLPGESLSKWKTHQHLPPEPPDAETRRLDESPVPDAVLFAPLSPLVPTGPEVDSVPAPDAHIDEPEAPIEHESFISHEPLAAHEPEHHDDHPHPELTEDEATAVAEHIADAQDELAARDAQQRGFAEADAIAEAAGLDAGEEDHDAEDASEDSEDAELEQEEAAAEEEGMIAHPEEEPGSEHEQEIAAAAGSAENISSLPGEISGGPAPQPFQARVRNDFRSRMQNPARRGRDRGRRDDRGRRPQHGHTGGHGHHRPQQPRRTQLIADMLKQGQEIIVQIAKEPLGKKGARITSHVALPGRFLVYMPTLDHTGVSRKIASAEERSRLRHLVNDAKGASGGGFIVRTAAASADPEEVRADVEFLTRTWAEIKARSEQRKAPSLLHRDLNLVERILRDFITPDFGAIWVDTEDEYTKVIDFMSRFQPQLVNRVKLYTKSTPVFEEFGIQQEIDKGLRPKVWLKSGGYIVINHTEALVAIDVNTGKFVGKGSNRLEDTIVRTNLEACKEIVRQMRLRDLGGIIIIDFIDMEERRNREKVMATLEDALRADRAPSKVLRFNEFGLVAITRKRTKQALERTLCQPCPYCTGSGMVKSIPTLCYEIQTEARKMAPDMDSGSLTLRVHPEISKALKTRESSLIEELERWTKKSVIIQADPTLHWEQYDIY